MAMSEAASELIGGCACGAIRYRMTSAPMFVHCCHCLDCQRQTGSAFVLNAIIEADRVVLDKGEPVSVALPSPSGAGHEAYRCETCQTAVWSDYGQRKVMLFVRVGTLDEPSALSPDVHIFTRTKQPWVGLPPEVPAFDIYYSTSSLWPEDSYKRRQAVLGKA
jgi:hypothetical protein